MRPWRNATRGLAFRLSAWTLTAAGLIFLLMTLATYAIAREALLQNAETHARTLTQALVMRIEARLAPIDRVPLGMAYEMEDSELANVPAILRRQRRVLADNADIFGTAVAFEPGGSLGERAEFYTYRTPQGPRSKRLGGASHPYQTRDWYRIPARTGRMTWCEPYFDKGGGGILMTTCAVPFFRGAGPARRMAGVVTADVSLEWLRRLVSSVRVLKTGYAWLISRNGTYLTHPEPGVAFNETVFSRADEHGDKRLREIGRDMLHGGSRFLTLRSLHTGKMGFLTYMPLHSTGWSLAVFSPRDELLADVHRQALVSGILGGGGFLLLAALIVLLSRTVTRPLRRLTAAAGEAAAGNLEADLPAPAAHDEVFELAMSFAHMQTALREHIRELTAATASRERMESELRIAHDIQMGILPKLFPPLPNRDEIDLFASLAPAREVGGDFYDYFSVGPDQFCFLVGDVSGKGVPAAFYMAVAKTLLKSVAESAARADERVAAARGNGAEGRVPDPGRILVRVNDDLSKDNESCMFVTIFIAVLDLLTGGVRFASAGHNPPLLLRAGGKPEYLPAPGEPVAGALPGARYTSGELALAPGDALLLYTDGVTEAMNPAQELFGSERLAERVAAARDLDARGVCERLAEDVRAFAAGAEQSDDITLLALHYRGSQKETKHRAPGN